MPRILAFQFCLLVLLCGSAFALSPAELDILRENSPEFSDAEQRLARVYGDVENATSGEARTALQAEQKAWLETGLEEDAAKLREAPNTSRTKAYVQAMENRIGALKARAAGPQTAASAGAPQAGAENMVEATGTGTGATKMEALQQAWLDAVRSGIGLFLTSKTVAVNDDVTEQIAMHSRGQVNAYEVLSERHAGDTWEITIKAKIDKDILQETASAAQSKTLRFDAKDDAAKVISKEEKHKSQADVLRASLDLFDFSKCFEYQNSLYKEQDRNGKTQYYIQHILKFDLKKFAAQEKQLEKVVASISEAKQEVPFRHLTPEDGEVYKRCLNLLTLKTYKPHIGYKDYNMILPYGGDKIIAYKPSVEPIVPEGYSMCFFKNVKNAECYSFGKKIGVGIPTVYELTFTAEGGEEGFDALLAETKGKIQFPYIIRRADAIGNPPPIFFITPIVQIKTPYATHWEFGPVIECVQRLELTHEQLLNIKEIKGSYSLRQLK